ncbi:hypothetical protein [Dactylosporangium sp. NPDC048998]|uniref:hypothetical protein n=1 Tax=Dactylosporangium sp. NPDC048998 TaxID=3363976 RepID=UPI003711E112
MAFEPRTVRVTRVMTVTTVVQTTVTTEERVVQLVKPDRTPTTDIAGSPAPQTALLKVLLEQVLPIAVNVLLLIWPLLS